MIKEMQGMRSSIKFWLKLSGGVLLLVLMVVWVAGGLRKRVSPGVLAAERGRALGATEASVVVHRKHVGTTVELPGTVASERTIHLSARISAYVKDVQIAPGARVKVGQKLVELDGRELREQLAAAEAQRAQATKEYTRAKELLAVQAGTRQADEQARSNYLAAEAAVKQIQVMLSYCQIDSPIDGVVTERRIEIGDLASPGQVLAAVYDPSRMRLEVPVPVRLLDELKQGQKVSVRLDRAEVVVAGQVSEIVSQVDPATRTQLVKVLLIDVDEALLPGTYGRVLLNLESHSTLLVPATSVRRAGQLEFVEELRDGRVFRVLVRTGPRHGDQVELLSGLVAGAHIVVPSEEGE
jgi:RND family efflux transporter MFP subunit